MSNINLTTSQGWGDLTPKQLLFVAKCYLRKLTKEEFLSVCFLKFTGCRPCWMAVKWHGIEQVYYFRYKRKKFSLTAEQLAGYCEQLAFLVEGIDLTIAPEIKKLAAPDFRLYEVTLDEFLIANTHYVAFSESQSDEHSCKLIATLWRPAGAAFDENSIEKRARRLRRLKPEVRQAVYIWYSGVKAWLRDKYPHVFTSSDSVGHIPQDEQLWGLLRMINGGKPQDNPMVLKTYVHEILFELDKRIEEYEKQKRKKQW